MGFVFLVDYRGGGRILQLPVPLCCGCFCCCNQQGVAAADDSWQDLDHGEILSSQ